MAKVELDGTPFMELLPKDDDGCLEGSVIRSGH
jgi:hypothetical protein